VFAVMPQVGVRAWVQLIDFARADIGFDFLYRCRVLRAGDQIDRRVNPMFLPPAQAIGGPALSALTPRNTDFWLHGVNAGLQFRFLAGSCRCAGAAEGSGS
jgi:hypothetical protein